MHLGTLSSERLDFLVAMLQDLFARRPTARALLIGIRPEHRVRLTAFPDARLTVLGSTPYAKIAGLLGNCRIGLDIHPVLYPHLRCAGAGEGL